MKKIFSFVALMLCYFFAFAQQRKATVTVNIAPVKVAYIWVSDPDNNVTKHTPDKDGRVVLEFTKSLPGMVRMGIDSPYKGSMALFLEDKDILHVTTDFDKNSSFTGRGARNNKLLDASQKRYLEGYSKLDGKASTYEQIFDQWTGLTQEMLDTVRANKAILSPAFYHKQIISLPYEKLSTAFTVAYIFTITSDSSLRKKPSETFNNKFWTMMKEVKMDEKLLTNNEYKNFMTGVYPKVLRLQELRRTGKLDTDTISREQKLMEEYRLVERYYTGKVRSLVMGKRLSRMLGEAKDVKTLRPLLDEYTKKYATALDAKELEATYTKVSTLAVGQVPPPFVLNSLEGKEVALKDFAGKVVYIDFWASWCGPCRGEMKNGAPQLHDRFKENKDVVFLYVSIDDSEDKWKKAIADDKIEGIHLLSTGGMNSVVAKAFNISSIPRYVLIGRDGKIVDNDTTRPSEPATITAIEKALSVAAN